MSDQFLLLRLCAIKAPGQSRGRGVPEGEWVAVQCVRGQRRPVRQVGGGFHDDDLVGLTSDVESSLVGKDTEVDQGKGLKLIRADVNRAADDSRVPVEVGRVRDVSIIPGVDAGGVGLEAQVAASLIHKQWRTGDVADAVAGRRCAAVVHGGGVGSTTDDAINHLAAIVVAARVEISIAEVAATSAIAV